MELLRREPMRALLGARRIARLICAAICYRNNHLRRPEAKMDDLRGSLSRMKKDIKHRLTGGKRKADKTGADGRGETADPSSSLLRLEIHVVAGGGGRREGNGSDAGGGVQLSAAADENKSDWKSTVSASTKLLLRGVRDSADAFPPLKSVAGGLCFILDNCEVRHPLLRTLSTTLISAAAYGGE